MTLTSESSFTFPGFIRKEICRRCLEGPEDKLLEMLFLGGKGESSLMEIMENAMPPGKSPEGRSETKGNEGVGGGPIPDISASSISKASDGLGSSSPRPIGPPRNSTYSVIGPSARSTRKEKAENTDIGTREDIQTLTERLLKAEKAAIREGKLHLTPKGARTLASRIIKRLRIRGVGMLGEITGKGKGKGMEILPFTRRFEPCQDPYELMDIEKTLLNALAKNPKIPISISTDDVEVKETGRESRVTFGIIVDESGSMKKGGKLKAAMEAALALWYLIKRDPKNDVVTVVFSREVKEIKPWEIPTNMVRESFTDIAKALMYFRTKTRNSQGEKVAYLITDSEPNIKDGRVVGFDKAKTCVIEEVARMRKEGIILNVIMLGSSPNLRELAQEMATKNLGTVVFTTPENLSRMIIRSFQKLK